MRDLQRHAEELRAQRDDMETRCRELSEERSALVDRLDDAMRNNRTVELQDEVDLLQKVNASLERKVSDLEDDARSMRSVSNLVTLDRQLSHLRAENDILKSRLASATSAVPIEPSKAKPAPVCIPSPPLPPTAIEPEEANKVLPPPPPPPPPTAIEPEEANEVLPPPPPPTAIEPEEANEVLPLPPPPPAIEPEEANEVMPLPPPPTIEPEEKRDVPAEPPPPPKKDALRRIPNMKVKTIKGRQYMASDSALFELLSDDEEPLGARVADLVKDTTGKTRVSWL